MSSSCFFISGLGLKEFTLAVDLHQFECAYPARVENLTCCFCGKLFSKVFRLVVNKPCYWLK